MQKSWAQQAADNALLVLPYLVDADEDTPVIDAAEVAQRIERVFRDRITWNNTILESELDWCVKIWLVVP